MSIDPEKLLFIFVIAVLVLGPERLPQMARTLGRGLAEVRKYTSGFQSEVGKVLAEPRAIIDAAVREADIRPDLRRANGAAGVPGPARTPSNGSASANEAVEPDDAEAPGPGSSAAAPGGYSGNGAAAAARAQRGRADLSPQTAQGAPDDPALN